MTTQKLVQSDFEDKLEAGPQTLKAGLWIAEEQRSRSIGCQALIVIKIKHNGSRVLEGK